MGFSKKHMFGEQQNQVALITKILGHPARIAIIQYVSENKSCNCNALVKSIGLAQPTISQHLNEIKKMGILDQNTEGKNLYYSINVTRLNTCRRLINDFFVKTQISSSK